MEINIILRSIASCMILGLMFYGLLRIHKWACEGEDENDEDEYDE